MLVYKSLQDDRKVLSYDIKSLLRLFPLALRQDDEDKTKKRAY